MTEDAEKTTAAGTASKEWQAGAKPNPHNDKDDGYMDIKTLDKPEDKPQVNELDDVSMDGPYSTVKGPAMNADAGQVQKDVKPADVVMVQNEDYEGIVGGKTSGQPGEVVMVENDDYEEFVAARSGLQLGQLQQFSDIHDSASEDY
ncbi:hypothetical protein LSAT2_011786 [Lamellibrachia satsuma]|nr:hypothetical protein LSAT2_011786 [Lamellibrachia satsuma]